VETATNGYEAGARTMAFRPDLLLIDYDLGDATALDVARTVRSDPALKRTRILCMSGYLTSEQAEAVLHQGVDDFIAKPIDLPDLRRRVLKLVGLS
jgi:CheY-like chemotaxis protein